MILMILMMKILMTLLALIGVPSAEEEINSTVRNIALDHDYFGGSVAVAGSDDSEEEDRAVDKGNAPDSFPSKVDLSLP